MPAVVLALLLAACGGDDGSSAEAPATTAEADELDDVDGVDATDDIDGDVCDSSASTVEVDVEAGFTVIDRGDALVGLVVTGNGYEDPIELCIGVLDEAGNQLAAGHAYVPAAPVGVELYTTTEVDDVPGASSLEIELRDEDHFFLERIPQQHVAVRDGEILPDATVTLFESDGEAYELEGTAVNDTDQQLDIVWVACVGFMDGEPAVGIRGQAEPLAPGATGEWWSTDLHGLSADEFRCSTYGMPI